MQDNNFGKFIYELRKEKGLTQKELADKLNISDKAVSRWENGKNYPDIETMQSLAEIFGVSVSELLEGKRLEQNEIVLQSNRRMISEIKKTKRLKIFITVFIISIIILAITGSALIIKEYKNPIIENRLDMKSSDVRSLLDNINAFIDPQENDGFVLTEFSAFMNTEKETDDMYYEGICNKSRYCGGALGLYNDLSYTTVYKYKEGTTYQQESEANYGISCLDFISFIDTIDFSKIDDSYSQSNTYKIDFDLGEYLEEKVEINDNSKRYVYNVNSKTIKQIDAGYELVGEYSYAMLYSVYEGSGTLLAFIFIELY